MRERPIRDVPRWVLALLGVALAVQLALGVGLPQPRAAAADLPRPPGLAALRLASFGDPIPLAKLLMLYLQAFDYQAGSRVPYRNLDYERLEAWLERILALDPDGQYPLMSASRLYAQVPDPAKQRRMLDFVYRRYLEDPNRRWPWLAHATILAKHELKDLPLARRYAVALQQHTTTPDAPVWVRQMEPFIVEDMNELEAAKILIGGLIASGQVKDERDLRLLERRLKALEARIEAERPRKP
jgi:hypothetical protein